jgi:hypothetical protein
MMEECVKVPHYFVVSCLLPVAFEMGKMAHENTSGLK